MCSLQCGHSHNLASFRSKNQENISNNVLTQCGHSHNFLTSFHGENQENIRNNVLTQCGQLHLPSGACSSSGSRQTR